MCACTNLRPCCAMQVAHPPARPGRGAFVVGGNRCPSVAGMPEPSSCGLQQVHANRYKWWCTLGPRKLATYSLAPTRLPIIRVLPGPQLLGFPVQLLGLLALPYLGLRYLVDGGDVTKDVETYTNAIVKKLPGGEGWPGGIKGTG